MFYTKYIFWLLIVSILLLILEKVFPWRKQKTIRPQFIQDTFWLFFNGYINKYIFYNLLSLLPLIYLALNKFAYNISNIKLNSVSLLQENSLVIQVLIYLILSDFIEWVVHNLLHRIPLLWKIHRVHHSIKIMDWIGNFRFHWSETIIYSSFKYIPLALLGVHWHVILIVAVTATTIGHINHSNIRISWGPLRFILNSPRMHIWHHDKKLRGKAGVNFGIVFSFWDWLFGTAYMPMEFEGPNEIGYHGEENVPENLWYRFFLPFYSKEKQK